MVQLLASLIEWLAMVALASVGIEFEPVGCASAEPAEYRTVAAVYVGTGSESVAWSLESASDCAEAAARAMQIDDTPRLITDLPRSYDS